MKVPISETTFAVSRLRNVCERNGRQRLFDGRPDESGNGSHLAFLSYQRDAGIPLEFDGDRTDWLARQRGPRPDEAFARLHCWQTIELQGGNHTLPRIGPVSRPRPSGCPHQTLMGRRCASVRNGLNPHVRGELQSFNVLRALVDSNPLRGNGFLCASFILKHQPGWKS